MEIARPQLPDEVADPDAPAIFLPSTELRDWIHTTFIDGPGAIVNPHHDHLKRAYIGYLLTNVPNSRNMNTVVGTAEMPMKKGGWGGAREQYQLSKWFGRVPHFLITLYAPYVAEAEDLEFCALIEHELYHCAQRREPWGEPKFTRDGYPVFAMKGHDVEEHVGVGARYGIGGCAGKTREFVDALMKPPLIGAAQIAGVCGTCRN